MMFYPYLFLMGSPHLPRRARHLPPPGAAGASRCKNARCAGRNMRTARRYVSPCACCPLATGDVRARFVLHSERS